MDIDHECAIIIKPGNEAIIIIMLTKVSGDRAGDLDKIIYRTSKKNLALLIIRHPLPKIVSNNSAKVVTRIIYYMLCMGIEWACGWNVEY